MLIKIKPAKCYGFSLEEAMKYNNIAKWITSSALCASLFSAPAFSEIIFEDSFDQVEISSIPFNPTPDLEWQYRFGTIYGVPTTASVGGGALTIQTEEPRFGGVSTSHSDVYDFFNQEITYTFDGLDLTPIGQSNPSQQWAKVGVIAGDGTIWYARSYFIVGFNGTGQFSVQVRQPSEANANRLEKVFIKDFKVPYFNFDSNDLSKIQITLDDTYFRILFVFANELDQISFGGEHQLRREDWIYDTVGLAGAKDSVRVAQILLDNAIDSGDQAAIDSAQENYNTRFEAYQQKLIEADPLMGNTSVLVATSSNDARQLRFSEGFTEVGSQISVNSVKVETTNILDVLRNPPL